MVPEVRADFALNRRRASPFTLSVGAAGAPQTVAVNVLNNPRRPRPLTPSINSADQ